MTSAEIQIDLFKDVADQCRQELQGAGYAPPSDDEDAVRAYLSVRHRRVEQRPRTVRKANYTVPAPLVTGEQQLLAKIAAGDDLRPNQSTRLADAAYDDAMLNDFGIQHFHLGIGPHPNNPSFVARTGDLLFAVVRPDDFYSLGIYNHQDWAKLDPLDVMHNHWPEVFATSTVANALDLAFTPAEEDVKELRKHNINAFTKRADGTIQAPPGGGQTLAGGSMAVTMGVIKLRQLVREVEKALVEDLQSKVDSGELPPKISVKLETRGVQTLAVLDKRLGDFDLGGRLWVAPI